MPKILKTLTKIMITNGDSEKLLVKKTMSLSNDVEHFVYLTIK